MRRVIALLAAVMAALALAGCSSGSEPRTDPFVGQWESTGGEQIQMTVDPPADGVYTVRIVGGTVDLTLEAKETGDKVYEAKPSTTVWTFRMVDDDLLNATAARKGEASATTSFKRIGG